MGRCLKAASDKKHYPAPLGILPYFCRQRVFRILQRTTNKHKHDGAASEGLVCSVQVVVMFVECTTLM